MQQLETHWSRILHHDLFAAQCGDNKEAFAASGRESGFSRPGSSARVVPILIAIAIAMCLAVTGVVHGLVSPDAAVVVPDSAVVPTSVITAPKTPVDAADAAPNRAFEPRI